MKLMGRKLWGGREVVVETHVIKPVDTVPKKPFLVRVKNFLRAMVRAAAQHVVDFFTGIWKHAEMTAILVLSSMGLNALLSQIPFLWAVPMWIEAPLVIPVLSVVIVALLVKLAEKRAFWRLEAVT